MGTPGVTKALDRIANVLESGSFYEAQQMYKTAYHRYKARKQLQESYDVLQAGAVLQLQRNQVTCGVELGLLLLEAYKDNKVSATSETTQAVESIINALPALPGTSTSGSEAEGVAEECSRLVTAAVKWANKTGNNQAARRFHDLFAKLLWKSGGWQSMGRALVHFIRGSDAAAFAQALRTCASHGIAQEEDLFVSRAVLQTLAAASKGSQSQQLAHARAVLNAYKQLQPQLDTPLIHFTDMLLQALERKAGQVVGLLKEKYSPSLQRDPSLETYVTKVEQVWFDIGGSGGPLGGLLNDLFKSLAQGEDEDEEGVENMDEDD